MRRARARRLAAVVAVSTSQAACCRSRPQVATQAGSGQAAQPSSEGVGGCDHERVELALGVGGGLDRRAPCGQPH
jgi:hypothetical protein